MMTSQNLSLAKAEWYGADPEDWLGYVIDVHFDPRWGSPYWLGRQRELGLNVRREIKTVEDLQRLGPMPEEDLRRFPVELFIPKCLIDNKTSLMLGESAGTTGSPKVTAYLYEEFYPVFVDWFGVVAERRGFPKGCNWLWLGPSGPHIIGKAVGLVAKRMESMDPFSIDFDPRWVKKLERNSVGYHRYIEHLMEQALNLITAQEIGVIFATPPILLELAMRMPEEKRCSIKGIHYGGMAIEKGLFKRFKEELFPNAVHISGYGNTLFGLSLEVEDSPNFDLDYYPFGPRMLIQVVAIKKDDQGQPEELPQTARERLSQIVDYGEEGQIVFHRLDKSFFIPNMLERDKGIRIAPSPAAESLGATLDGVRNPRVLEKFENKVKVGLY
ncbi:MAG: hypothetical protein ACK4WF_01040 [Candidatus Brocadiales bacterium]